MCEPVTIATIAGTLTAGAAGTFGTALTAMQAVSLGATAASGVMSAGAAYQQGQAAKQMANYNATMSEYAAQDAQRRGEEEAIAVQRKAAGLKGAQRAAMAAKGLDLGVGTQADILDQTDFFAESDVNTTRFNAAREAWGMRARKDLQRYEGRMAARNANMQAAGTLLGTAGSVAGKWYDYNPTKQMVDPFGVPYRS